MLAVRMRKTLATSCNIATDVAVDREDFLSVMYMARHGTDFGMIFWTGTVRTGTDRKIWGPARIDPARILEWHGSVQHGSARILEWTGTPNLRIFFQKSRFLDFYVQILEYFFKNHAFWILMSKSWKIFSKITLFGRISTLGSKSSTIGQSAENYGGEKIGFAFTRVYIRSCTFFQDLDIKKHEF